MSQKQALAELLAIDDLVQIIYQEGQLPRGAYDAAIEELMEMWSVVN